MNESARAETEQKWKDNNIRAKSLVGLEVDVRSTETDIRQTDWLTQGKTLLMVKDSYKGKTLVNF